MQAQIRTCTSQLSVSVANSILITPPKNKEVFNAFDTIRGRLQCEGVDMDTFLRLKKQLQESMQNSIKDITIVQYFT